MSAIPLKKTQNVLTRQVTLKTRHADGRAAIIVGMERYRELKLQRLLSLPDKNKGALDIPDSIVDTEYNANGEEVYRCCE